MPVKSMKDMDHVTMDNMKKTKTPQQWEQKAWQRWHRDSWQMLTRNWWSIARGQFITALVLFKYVNSSMVANYTPARNLHGFGRIR